MTDERGQSDDAAAAALAIARSRVLIEESREVVVVLDAEHRVLAASRRAREEIEGLEEGEIAPPEVLEANGGRAAFTVPYQVGEHRETIVYLGSPGELAAYEELRAGFTAAVSHELRTPLARLLALLETALLPGSDPTELIEQARSEVEQIGELIDDVLFLGELETGKQVVALGSTHALPVLEEVITDCAESAARAGVELALACDPDVELPLRPRMLRVVAKNLTENAVRYAGPGASFRLTAGRDDGTVVLEGSDDGVGVSEHDLPRLFERFYRTDRARTSRGTGLGLAIVKHIVTSAGGTVEATGARGGGVTIRATFPAP
jgi:two-component system phosphate regulon sensor histidine kinase PhoR